VLPVDDRLALRELVEAYGLSVDALDVSWFSSLFTAAAVLVVHDAGGEVRRWEGDGIGEMLAGVHRYLRTFHFVGNHAVRGEGDTVSGQTSCFAHHLRTVDDAGSPPARDRVVAIRYDDEYARDATDGTWRFARRDVRILWRTLHDVEELGVAP